MSAGAVYHVGSLYPRLAHSHLVANRIQQNLTLLAFSLARLGDEVALTITFE